MTTMARNGENGSFCFGVLLGSSSKIEIVSFTYRSTEIDSLLHGQLLRSVG